MNHLMLNIFPLCIVSTNRKKSKKELLQIQAEETEENKKTFRIYTESLKIRPARFLSIEAQIVTLIWELLVLIGSLLLDTLAVT